MQVIRIHAINLNPNKQVWISITAIYGVGASTGKKLCRDLGIGLHTKVKDLDSEQADRIRQYLEGIPLEGDLRKVVRTNIQNLLHIKSYRGNRHRYSLPCRGQNTKTNAATSKKRPLVKI